MKKLLILLISVLVFACQKQSEEPTVYKIEDDFSVYMQTFTNEAKKRGIEIKTENLIIKFGTTVDEICGQYNNPQNGSQRIITINNDAYCWQNAPNENREALIFHELGHCLLGRLHRDDKLPNGVVASIMNSQNDGPYEPCLYPIAGDTTCNRTSRRSYYIDELFNPQTPVPAWGK